MQQFHHRSFELRAESEAERDAWVDALRSEVPVRGMDRTRSSSATPVTSSAATPIGTPSSIGKRAISKFGGSRRRGQQNEAKDKRRRPTIQGWAKTQNHRKVRWVCVSLLCVTDLSCSRLILWCLTHNPCLNRVVISGRGGNGALPVRAKTRVIMLTCH